MQIIRNLSYVSDNKEENLPEFEAGFPYICTQARIHEYPSRYVPWHWHAAVELFYMEKGQLEYTLPGGKYQIQEGMAGLINSNVLHATKPIQEHCEIIQKLHIFDTSFIAGPAGSRITQKYITPLINSSLFECIMIEPKTEKEKKLLERIKDSFTLNEAQTGYELILRNYLSQIWLDIFELVDLKEKNQPIEGRNRDGLKAMLVYIHEHFAEKITIEEVAQVGFVSVRECYRVFNTGIHCTPMDYLNEYRIRMACHLLMNSGRNITEIAQRCGFGNSSYFTRRFQQKMGCSPSTFRLQQRHS